MLDCVRAHGANTIVGSKAPVRGVTAAGAIHFVIIPGNVEAHSLDDACGEIAHRQQLEYHTGLPIPCGTQTAGVLEWISEYHAGVKNVARFEWAAGGDPTAH